MKASVFAGLIAFGMVLFGLSGLWTTLFPATSSWTPEKSARSSKIGERIHNLAFIVNAPKPSMHSGQDLGQLKAEFEQLKKEDEQLKAEFSSATDKPKTTSKVLKWSGISLAAVGIVGWYAVNQQK